MNVKRLLCCLLTTAIMLTAVFANPGVAYAEQATGQTVSVSSDPYHSYIDMDSSGTVNKGDMIYIGTEGLYLWDPANDMNSTTDDIKAVAANKVDVNSYLQSDSAAPISPDVTSIQNQINKYAEKLSSLCPEDYGITIAGSRLSSQNVNGNKQQTWLFAFDWYSLHKHNTWGIFLTLLVRSSGIAEESGYTSQAYCRPVVAIKADKVTKIVNAMHTVAIPNHENGQIGITTNGNHNNVVVTVVPNHGYTLESLKYEYRDLAGEPAFENIDIDSKEFTMPATDITIHAVFQKQEFTVTFDSKEGTAVDQQKVLYLETATAPAEPQKTGYLFGGWYTDENYDTMWDFSNDKVTGNTTLHAKWAACSHSGSTQQPTHTDDAVCSICNGTIAAEGHTFDQTVVHEDYLKSVADCINKNIYYKSCVCGVSSKGIAEEAIFEVGTANGHNHTVLQYDANQHWLKCANCDDKTEKTNHSGGTFNFINKAICSVCSQPYGEATGVTATYGDTLADVLLPAGWTWKEEATTKVGNVGANAFTAVFTPENANNYIAEDTIPVSVAQREIGIDWTNTAFIYDGTAKLPTATMKNVVTGDTITLTVEGAQTDASATAYTATVTAITGIAADNYKLPTNVTAQFTIDQATPDIGTVSVSGTVKDTTVPADVALTYTGSTAGTLAITDSAMLADKPEHNWKFTPNDTTNYKAATGTVAIDVLDTAAPTATITVADNQWKATLNNITFGLFFKDKQTVSITSADNEHGSGIKTVEYCVADAAVTDFASVQWTKYNGAFSINLDSKYVIYAKVTDNDGNSITVNSDGMIVDATKPAVENITNDGIYYGDLEITVTDVLAGVKEVKVDGTPVTMTDGKYTITADNAQHTVLVTDNAGNEISYAITVCKNYAVTYKVDGSVVTTKTAGHGLKPDLTIEIPDKEGYDETAPYWAIDGKKVTEETVITQDTTITAVYTKNEPGVYKNTTPTTNEGGAVLANTMEHLKEAVLFTSKELVKIEQGKDVKLWLEVTDISDTVPAADKALVEAKLDGKTLGMYLDVDMYKQIGTDTPEAVTQFNRLIKISLVLDDSLINTNSNVSRTYSVIRVHNGVADYIGCEFDAATKTLSFETDRLSTYAVVYKDTVIKTDSSTTQTTTPTVSNVPNTGDTTNAVLWLVLVISSMAAVVVITKNVKILNH